MKSVINNHNIKVLNNTAEIKERNKHYLRSKDHFKPVQRLTKYLYLECRFNNHTKYFNLKQYKNNTKLSKEYWAMKRNHFTPEVTWRESFQ